VPPAVEQNCGYKVAARYLPSFANMPGKRTWQQMQLFGSPALIQPISADKLSRGERLRRREEKIREREVAKQSICRFVAAHAHRWRALNVRAIDQLKISIGDEIVFKEDAIVWTVRDIDYRNGACLLHKFYGDERLLIKDEGLDEKVPRNISDYYNRSQQSKRIIGLGLASEHSEQRMELVKTKPVAPRKETTLMESCLQTISRQCRLLQSPGIDVLPVFLQDEISTRLREVAPIPIQISIRHLIAHGSDTSPCSSACETMADVHWKAQSWMLCPEALSYRCIWYACARALRRSRPAKPPDGTIAVLDLEPAGGAAAFLRAYAAACRGGERRFELRFDHVWRTIEAPRACTHPGCSNPACRGGRRHAPRAGASMAARKAAPAATLLGAPP
jgi:hypothetical protein